MTKHFLVLGTGGTIAGSAGSAIRRDYRPGQIAIDDFLGSVAPLGLNARLTGRQIANMGSEDIGWPVWHKLHTAIVQAMDDPEFDAIIITHGTDTAEETAFLLDRTLPSIKPVIIVGAMRAADAVGSDGLRNFANAMQVAGDRQAPGRGVMVVMNDFVHSARDVRKAHTSGTDAFRGFPRGPIAMVTPSSLEWFGEPWRQGEEARFPFPDRLPQIAMLYAFAGMEPVLVEQAVATGAKGIVLAGFGTGNMPQTIRAALTEAAGAGLLVVRSTRVDEGLVDIEPDDAACGFVAARALNPQKSRILLQLLLADGIADPARAQQEFNRR